MWNITLCGILDAVQKCLIQFTKPVASPREYRAIVMQQTLLKKAKIAEYCTNPKTLADIISRSVRLRLQWQNSDDQNETVNRSWGLQRWHFQNWKELEKWIDLEIELKKHDLRLVSVDILEFIPETPLKHVCLQSLTETRRDKEEHCIDQISSAGRNYPIYR
jgi:hypothetical protein